MTVAPGVNAFTKQEQSFAFLTHAVSLKEVNGRGEIQETRRDQMSLLGQDEKPQEKEAGGTGQERQTRRRKGMRAVLGEELMGKRRRRH